MDVQTPCLHTKSFQTKEYKMSSLMHRGNFLDDFFRDVAPSYYVKPLHGDPLPGAQQIKIDVKENDSAYTVHAEIPGVPKEDIHITLDGPVVTLSAEVKQHDSSSRNEKVLRSERYYGAVSRSFQLPVDIDQDRSSAKFDNGVLTLTLAKRQAGTGAQRLAID